MLELSRRALIALDRLENEGRSTRKERIMIEGAKNEPINRLIGLVSRGALRNFDDNFATEIVQWFEGRRQRLGFLAMLRHDGGVTGDEGGLAINKLARTNYRKKLTRLVFPIIVLLRIVRSRARVSHSNRYIYSHIYAHVRVRNYS